MTTLSSTRELKEGKNTIKVEWWIGSFWDNLRQEKSFYSTILPRESSTLKFRLQVKLIETADITYMPIYFCLWNDSFQEYIQPLNKVTVKLTKKSAVTHTTSNLLLQDTDIYSSGYTSLQYNAWILINTYTISATYKNINNMFIKLFIEYEVPNFVPDNLTQTINVCNFSELFDDGSYCDMTVEAGDGSSKRAHRTVLVTHSRTLHTLLRPSTDEEVEPSIQIKELNESSLNVFLKFLYTGNLGNLELNECKVMLRLSYKFEISVLKLIAQEHIYKLMSVDNAMDILILACETNCDQLKQLTIHFIKENGLSAFTHSEGWDLLKNTPSVSIYLLEQLFI